MKQIERLDKSSRVALRWGLSVLEQAKVDIALRKQAMERKSVDVVGQSLLHIYNERLLEFVVQIGPNAYEPVLFKQHATHRLVPTKWNEEPSPQMPHSWYALSVCAVPIDREILPMPIHLKKKIPKSMPVYKESMSLKSKWGTIRAFVKATKARVRLGDVVQMSSKECDELYHLIRKSNQILIRNKTLLKDLTEG